MNIFLFFIIYSFMAVLCSLFIVGWYGITRGEIVHNEDGTVTKKGKIFKGWHFFWDKKKLVENTSKSVTLNVDRWVYVWPEWARYPLSECLSCMSSVYGSLFYWIFMWQIGYKTLYVWAEKPLMMCVIGWVFFCIILSTLNPIFYKKTL